MSAPFFAFIVLTLCGVSSVPIVLKESSPNGESIIAISSSDPEVEKYLLNTYASQRVNPESSLLRSNFYSPETQGSKSGVKPAESSITGTGRNFGESSYINPFFVPFLLPSSLNGFQLNNWFRNIENVYDNSNPSYAGNTEVRTVPAVNDNGHVYGKIKTVHFDNKKP